MKNRIGSFFKRAWKAIKRPSLSFGTRMEPSVAPPADAEQDPEPADPDSSCSAGPSGFKPTDGESAPSITVVPCKNKQFKSDYFVLLYTKKSL